MSDQKTAAELAAEVKVDFGQKLDAVKEMAEKAIADAKNGFDQTAAQKEVIDNALTGMNEAKARLDELEQKVARSGGNPADAEKSYGQQFVETDPVTIRAGAPYPNGRASTEVLVPGNMSALPLQHLRDGAFLVATGSPAGAGTIRDVRVEGGQTILRGETADFTGDMSGSNWLYFKRDNTGGNLSDSDDTLAHYGFRDTTYGTRQGQLYPLNNFCIQFVQTVRTA